jgi:predicted RNA binding protein YcfA (HicA-like mRNA interferase family)
MLQPPFDNATFKEHIENMPMMGKEMLKLYLKNDWVLDHVTGSYHTVMRNNISVSIPVHNKDLEKDTEQKLLKLGGFK